MTTVIHRRPALLAGSAVAATGLLLAACSRGETTTPSAGASAKASLSAQCTPFADYMGHRGTTVTMFGSILSPESDSLQESWADVSTCTGLTIAYEGSNGFESQLPVRVSGGNAPDLAIFPQPGLLQRMVAAGAAKVAPQSVSANVDTYWTKDWKTYATVGGKFYGAPMSANMKSLVWYSPTMFKAAGCTVPTTWDDMMKLSDTIAAAGSVKPWCGGIGSGTATGWPATDWLEEIVMRSQGPAVYDKWVNHDITFSSPEIKASMAILDKWMKNPASVNGGYGDVATIATTTCQDAGLPDPQGPVLHAAAGLVLRRAVAEGDEGRPRR